MILILIRCHVRQSQGEALAACEEWSVTPAATSLADCFQDEDLGALKN